MCTTFLITNYAKADTVIENKPRVVRDCVLNDNLTCIKKISVITSSGKVLIAKLTGRNAGIEPELIGGAYDEYQVDQIQFEDPANGKFIPRIVFYADRDFYQIGIQPSWLDRDATSNSKFLIEMPNRPDNKLCGSVSQRDYCYRSANFIADIQFVIDIQVPSSFNPNWLTGSTKNVNVQTKDVGQKIGFKLMTVSLGTLERQMDLFSDYYKSPIDAIDSSPYADFLADWPNLWINGENFTSKIASPACSSTPYISITTNSIYQDFPAWNAKDSSIDIKLFAPHLKTDGTLNKGFYELKVTKDLAKCLWGIDVSSKTKASISISYTDGTADKSVESLQTSFKDGIFTVVASNFTFSSPTVKAKIGEELAVIGNSNLPIAPTVNQNEITKSNAISPAPTKISPKKVTISCIKGKIVKKITSVNPACPKGYRKT